MITAVDTSILLDVLTDDLEHAAPSEALLARAFQQGGLIICPVVYAELTPSARDRRQLDGWLQRGGIRTLALTADHGHAAGLAHAAYRKAGGKRDRVLADFLIGAHALHEANRLLTRDRGFYRKYFAGLEILDR
jgi:predicted nucleic acid-binding protein